MTKLSISRIPRVSPTVTNYGKAKTIHQRQRQKTEKAQKAQKADQPSA